MICVNLHILGFPEIWSTCLDLSYLIPWPLLKVSNDFLTFLKRFQISVFVGLVYNIRQKTSVSDMVFHNHVWSFCLYLPIIPNAEISEDDNLIILYTWLFTILPTLFARDLECAAYWTVYVRCSRVIYSPLASINHTQIYSQMYLNPNPPRTLLDGPRLSFRTLHWNYRILFFVVMFVSKSVPHLYDQSLRFLLLYLVY